LGENDKRGGEEERYVDPTPNSVCLSRRMTVTPGGCQPLRKTKQTRPSRDGGEEMRTVIILNLGDISTDFEEVKAPC
jgi:hypothetical protein